MTYALAHCTKLKPTINPVKCRYIKVEEITQFHQRNRMISENAWNALIRIGGSMYKLYHSWEGYNLHILPQFLNTFLSTDIPLIHLLFPLK